MTSYFAQIQYVPNPILGERINIGVVVVDANGSRFEFVKDWRRAASFGGEDVGFLREFADEAAQAGAQWLTLGEPPSPDYLSKVLRRWHNKIQFSELKPSIKSKEALLDAVAPMILRLEPDAVHHGRQIGRGRDKAVTSVSRAIGTAMRNRFGHAPRGLIQRDVQVEGEIETHQLDLAVKNGSLYGGTFAISFETGSPKMQQRDTDAIAFAIDDISEKLEDIELAVVAIPPRGGRSPTYERARHIFKEIDAKLVLEPALPKWASEMVDRLPDEVVSE